MVNLALLGWGPAFSQHVIDFEAPVGRVLSSYPGGYVVMTATEEVEAVLPGRYKQEGVTRLDLPGVGDWVELSREPPYRVEQVLPRRTAWVRQAAGRRTEPQLLAANLDTVFIVTAAGADLNPRRLERYLVATRECGARPVVLINKADLVEPGELAEQQRAAEEVAGDAPVLAVSAKSLQGVEVIRSWLHAGETFAFIGSSGVGKSTLINALVGEARQATAEVRATDNRGRHTTTRGELLVLPFGVLVDTPGMRELQLWASPGALDETFDDVTTVASACRFADCQHETEPGCAVREALAAGTLAMDRLESWRKLQREQAHQARRQDAVAAADQKRKWKVLHKDARKRAKAKRGE